MSEQPLGKFVAAALFVGIVLVSTLGSARATPTTSPVVAEGVPAFGSDGVLIVTFYEGITNGPNHADKFGNGGNVAFAVISPLAVAGSYRAEYDHYGLLRTIEDGFRLTYYLGNATAAIPITPIWER